MSETRRELEYLQQCVEAGELKLGGSWVKRFEQRFAEYHGQRHAVAVDSGTAAIHLGLAGLGVGPGDAVLCPTMTFIGSINPIRYCGAEPLFLGVKPGTLNLDPQALESFLRHETQRSAGGLRHLRTNKRVAALVVVHLYGVPAHMEPILELCRAHGLPVLEDAAESLGARYQSRLAGTLGDVSCFSFNSNKLITTAGGGMLLSNNEQIAARCRHLRAHAKSDPFEYLHDAVGYNYRLSNLCAAVGLAQLERLDAIIQRASEQRAEFATRFAERGIIEVLPEPGDCRANGWMTLARVRGVPDFQARLKRLVQAGVSVRPVWYPAHLLPIYRDASYHGEGRELEFYTQTFGLPSQPMLTGAAMQEAVRRIEEAMIV
jgi:perosamine synthetase